MPIVLVCNAELDIVWTDASFCDVIDCDAAPPLGRSLADFLGVGPEDPLRARLRGVAGGQGNARHAAQLPRVGGGTLQIEFYLEPMPTFEGVEDSALIGVGVGAGAPQALAQVAEAAPAVTSGEADPLRRAYRYSNLRLEDGAGLFARLERIVEGGELYRRQDFSLETAATRLSTNALYVSQAINFFSGMSFPNYLNSKRLKTLEAALRARPNASFEVLWREAGFGSYSSLNRYLKSQLGVSPSKFVGRVRGGA